MDFLLTHKKIVEKEDIDIVIKFTYVKTTKFEDFTQYTYSIATTKKGPTQFEDYIYNNYPILVSAISRGFSIIVKNDKIISVLEGPIKFSGKTAVDEDPEDNQEETQDTIDTSIYDHKKILKWASRKELEIIETEKANGKFVIFKIVLVNGVFYLHTGSKNKHLFFPLDKLDFYIASLDSGLIISSILSDVKSNINKIFKPELLDKFAQGYSLCGELCDGQHFMSGDNTVSWFGLFKSGHSMKTLECFEFIKDIGLKTVEWSTVYTAESDLSTLDNVFIASRCKLNEGSVLRCRNTVTNEIILVKTKSVSYITKRFMRQSIIKGYAYMVDSVKKRFIDAQKYHGLNTSASIRMCNQLSKFGFWLMDKEYPVSVLGHVPVNSIRGCLPNGFSYYWNKYLAETEDNEQVFTFEDFGDFDECAFSSSTEPYVSRNYTNPAIVLFLQGLQGSGKSTLGQHVKYELEKTGKKVVIVEQDRFYGCTISCQGYLFHNIKNSLGPDIILVTRCNANPKQYERYLQICHKLPSLVSFAVPHCVDELYLGVCLEGVLNRSSSGDLMIVGRKEYPIEEATEFIFGNYRDFKRQRTNNEIHVYTPDDKLLDLAKKTYSQSIKTKNNKVYTDWVIANKDELHEIRCSIPALGNEIIKIINKTSNGENLILNDKPMYIGLGVQENDRANLINFIKLHNSIIDYSKSSTYIHHCTQLYLGGKDIIPKNKSYCKPLDYVDAVIDGLIIRKIDGACCFRIKKNSLMIGKDKIELDQIPHITGIIPYNEKPAISNQFIGSENHSVKFVPMNYSLVLVGFYA